MYNDKRKASLRHHMQRAFVIEDGHSKRYLLGYSTLTPTRDDSTNQPIPRNADYAATQ